MAVAASGQGGGVAEMLARCTAERLALHEVIKPAEAYLGDAVLDIDLAAALPDHGDQHHEFNHARTPPRRPRRPHARQPSARRHQRLRHQR
jgi:hypothetical protein